jgi:hypothetical protein
MSPSLQGRTVSFEDLECVIPSIEIWDNVGQCFEFAHFTDAELAVALHTVDGGRGAPAPPKLETILNNVRRKQRRPGRGASIGSVWKLWKREPSKTRLADALWPGPVSAGRILSRERPHTGRLIGPRGIWLNGPVLSRIVAHLITGVYSSCPASTLAFDRWVTTGARLGAAGSRPCL